MNASRGNTVSWLHTVRNLDEDGDFQSIHREKDLRFRDLAKDSRAVISFFFLQTAMLSG